METRELATIWARNRAIVDEWMDEYCKRTGQGRDDVIADRKAHGTHDPDAVKVGTFDGYSLTAIEVGGGTWRYVVATPWGQGEGLCDTDARNDEFAIRKLHEVDSLMPEAMEAVKSEREGKRKAQSVANAAKSTTKRTVRPKDEPKVDEKVEKAPEEPKEEPKVAPKRKRGRPKGSKDSKPRTRRTKAQLIAEGERIMANLRAKERENEQTPAIVEKTPQNGSQEPTEPVKSHRDELGRVPCGDDAMHVTNWVAWVQNDMGRYEPRTIWTDREYDYILEGDFFVPIPAGAIKAYFDETPGIVFSSNWKRNFY